MFSEKGKTGRRGKPVRIRKGPPGTPPGTIRVAEGARPPTVTVIAYGQDDCHEQEVSDLSELRPLVDQHPVTWINVDGIGDAEVVRRIGELFRLHPLVMEDVATVHQRPKTEDHREHLYIVVRMLHANEGLESEQLSIILGKNFVITFQEHAGDCLDPVRNRIRGGQGRVRELGADYLAYALVDAVVDWYFPLLEQYGERIEALEDRVLSTPDQGSVRQIRDMKTDLLVFRRGVWPLRETLNSLIREATPLIADETRTYLRDCYDHTIQIMDIIETYREISSGLMDIYLSSISNRMNEVMKVLTIIATIFIPLTFVAGIYGMNFNPDKSPLNMPELNSYWGYPMALGVMAIIAVGLVFYFRKKKWL